MKIISIAAILYLLLGGYLNAKEGIWMPILFEKYNLEEMHQEGFRLSSKDIYDINQSSMKDAVVLFGEGCTGEIISGEGLILTNHHCCDEFIQSHSTLENNYLDNGFWAMSKKEELPNKGLKIRILETIEDVTEKVLESTDTIKDIDACMKQVHDNIKKIESDTTGREGSEVRVKPVFYGNQYFRYTYKVFKDIRLVGAPPTSIARFGGDTDNWMWPRHAGDFSIFRIYANKDNQPAEYSEENIPYKPKYFFPVSLKGVKPGDFTLIYGFPGTTSEYLYSDAVDLIMNQRDPDRIKIREVKKTIVSKNMDADPKVKIQYSAKYSGIANAWKKWQGEIKGLKRVGALEKKISFEEDFKQWAIENGKWENEYQDVFNSLEIFYAQYAKYIKASDYYSEIVWKGVEIFTLASKVDHFIKKTEQKEKDSLDNEADSLLEEIDIFYKDYSPTVDEELFENLFPMLIKDLDPRFIPKDLAQMIEKQGYMKLKENLFDKSILSNHDLLAQMVKKGGIKQIKKLKEDPSMKIYRLLRWHYDTEDEPYLSVIETSITDLMRKYIVGVMEMKNGQSFYPDANGTLRVSYGKVEGYEPEDGVVYNYFTTLEGVMEKYNPDDGQFDIPEKLKDLYETKDFGDYDEDGEMPVCFVASNHTSGGNSGSPVINADGQLIGVNFDRCWEGTMSDIQYDPNLCRNISLDIRYLLFIIDKFAGADYLFDEMKLVR